MNLSKQNLFLVHSTLIWVQIIFSFRESLWLFIFNCSQSYCQCLNVFVSCCRASPTSDWPYVWLFWSKRAEICSRRYEWAEHLLATLSLHKRGATFTVNFLHFFYLWCELKIALPITKCSYHLWWKWTIRFGSTVIIYYCYLF